MDNKNRNNNKPGNGNNDNSNNRKSLLYILIAAVIVLIFFSIVVKQLQDGTRVEVTYNKFLSMLDEGKLKEVLIQSDKILFEPKEQPSDVYAITYYTGAINDEQLVSRLEKAVQDKKIENFKRDNSDTRSSILDIILAWVLPFVLIYVVMYFLFRMISKSSGGMMGGVGKSNAKVYVEKETGVNFKDVAGQEEAKESLKELVDFLHNPGKYTRIGAKLPKGALLVGPPGTGKTLLAKAVAGEAKVPFFSLSGSDFVEMFVGVGASRVRDLFKQAQQMAPCIIFIDEVDAIGKSRDNHYGGGNDEREQTLNQLLSEMDGFDSSKGLVILAATNRPEVLDKALLRPGRFDRRVIVDKPDLKGRVDILKVHAKDVLMHDSVDLEAIALATSGAVGSDLANMINEAAILAVKQGRNVVTQEDLFESVEVVIAGKEKKDRILSKEEKKIVAYHEVGHALVTALEKNAEPVQKITIVPRTMGSLGYVMQVPEEEKYLMSKEELIARIVTLYGGRAAEELVFNSITTGASNDIEKATQLARSMVTQYGMSEKFGLMGLESIENRYLDGRAVLNCGDATAAEIDHEVMEILKRCYTKAQELLAGNRIILDRITEFLIEKETITGKEFMEILNKAREEQGLPPLGKKESTDKIAEVTGESVGSILIDGDSLKKAGIDDKVNNNDQADKKDNADKEEKNTPQDPFSSHVIDIDINKETTD
ncbi:ATP-dependent zinc metalloprotease FtsH [Anaerocolumna sp. AGMB13020]|uniref:ATP-dependent zinc metalloprotease FtsH n=1 Tax=Anaerocolumna sp. AGMB13020 TaxID=3081750 RepID=UPI0029532CD7|nr:ATP-dependent zinc metalloprotease FtsH [Anaerocolumna sp. AGMB13020]WOO35167.1 ATP-dependent zinc metalloprotease FtsH [Anaerocolumna sp. AGMB13020]